MPVKNKIRTEKHIERFCIKETERRKGIALKWSSPSRVGVPDRILLFPEGRIGFLELKAPNKKPTVLQEHWLKVLTKLGFKAAYANSFKKVEKFIDLVKNDTETE